MTTTVNQTFSDNRNSDLALTGFHRYTIHQRMSLSCMCSVIYHRLRRRVLKPHNYVFFLAVGEERGGGSSSPAVMAPPMTLECFTLINQ